MLRWHENNIGWHFYLPVRPHHLFGFDLYLVRLNLYFPFYIAMSFGMLGRKGLQIGFGIKYDPTETLKLQEYDYLFSAHFRIHKIGMNPIVNAQASI